jgi:hypothetical protein
MCKYCEEAKEFQIEFTRYLEIKGSKEYFKCFLNTHPEDEKGALMIGNCEGYRYIIIQYCPFCGRRLGDD